MALLTSVPAVPVCIELPPVVELAEGPSSTAPFCFEGSLDPRCRVTPQPAVPARVLSAPGLELLGVAAFETPAPISAVGDLTWSYAGDARDGFGRAPDRPPASL